MMSLTFGLFTQVSASGPLGPLVLHVRKSVRLCSTVLVTATFPTEFDAGI